MTHVSVYEDDLRDLIDAGVETNDAIEMLENGIPEESFDTPDWPTDIEPRFADDEELRRVQKESERDPRWIATKRRADELRKARLDRAPEDDEDPEVEREILKLIDQGLTREQAESAVLDDPESFDAVVDGQGNREPNERGPYFT